MNTHPHRPPFPLVTLASLVFAALIALPRSADADELPEEAATLVAAFEEDAEAIAFEAERRIQRLRKEAAEALEPIQDEYTRAAKLDEAVAIRDARLELTNERPYAGGTELPKAAAEIVAQLDRDAAAVRRETGATIREQRRELATGLQQLQDTYTRAAKLEEAVAIRDTIRALKQGFSNAAPDPGSISGLATEEGRVHYFKVTGVSSGSVWGTHVFTADSRISVAAVHSGVLRDGETGIVKVTVLPGRASYTGSTRNGVTTASYGGYSRSYGVAKVLGGFAEPDEAADANGPDEAAARAPK
jgi:hypothetical protein